METAEREYIDKSLMLFSLTKILINFSYPKYKNPKDLSPTKLDGVRKGTCRVRQLGNEAIFSSCYSFSPHLHLNEVLGVLFCISDASLTLDFCLQKSLWKIFLWLHQHYFNIYQSRGVRFYLVSISQSLVSTYIDG